MRANRLARDLLERQLERRRRRQRRLITLAHLAERSIGKSGSLALGAAPHTHRLWPQLSRDSYPNGWDFRLSLWRAHLSARLDCWLSSESSFRLAFK